jgi:hypothetical protein
MYASGSSRRSVLLASMALATAAEGRSSRTASRIVASRGSVDIFRAMVPAW